MVEKIEESLRQSKGGEHLNDDEIMELCILMNELNACEATAILSPSRFVSHAARLGLCEGFSVDLTAARANGILWRIQPSRRQNRTSTNAKSRAA